MDKKIVIVFLGSTTYQNFIRSMYIVLFHCTILTHNWIQIILLHHLGNKNVEFIMRYFYFHYFMAPFKYHSRPTFSSAKKISLQIKDSPEILLLNSYDKAVYLFTFGI